jgi:hypothetical protein
VSIVGWYVKETVVSGNRVYLVCRGFVGNIVVGIQVDDIRSM